MIHKGNYEKAMEILKPYLLGVPTPNYYLHGVALYELRLIHCATKNKEVINFLINLLKTQPHNQYEVFVHGACLGLGLTCFASADDSIY